MLLRCRLPSPSRPSRPVRSLGLPLFLALVLWNSARLPCAGAEIEYAVIASPDVPVSNISLDELRRLFLFVKKYWKPGQPVTILISEGGLRPGSFVLRRIYQVKDEASLRRLILEKLYQWHIDLAPKIVASDQHAIAFVAAGRGLLAVVQADQVRGAGVKILSINGLSPGSPGYPGRSESVERDFP